ncbi:MAG: TIGR02099 family protein, partial [Gammaproteobacteria bacterium]
DFLISLLDKPQTHLNHLKTYLAWEKQADGWNFETQQLTITSEDILWPDPSIKVKMTADKEQQQYNINVTQLDMGIWADLILTNPNLDDATRDQLLSMNPGGFLYDTQIEAHLDNRKLVDFRANAKFSDLTWKPWKKIPGANNIAGQFEIHEDRGMLVIDSRNSILDYPSLFRWPFQTENINSQISWNISERLLSFELSHLVVALPEARLIADGIFNIERSSGALDMNLYGELDNINIANIKYFLPNAIMSNNLVTYLDKSIKSGLLTRAQVALRGPAPSFPFSNEEGVFAINAQIENTSFSFTDGWPELNNLSADLWFVENSMDIKINGGTSNGQTIKSASAIIPDFSAKPSLLEVKSSSFGDVEDGIDYLNNSPLKESVGSIFNIIPTKGPFSLDLDLTIPLGNEVKVTVDGKVKLLGNSLQVAPIDMAIENIQGEININDSLVSAENISADFMSGKSQVDLIQQRDADGMVSTKVISKGNVESSGIREVFPRWIPQLVQGNTDYVSEIILPKADNKNSATMELTVESDLKGISSSFPAPFLKQPEQSEAFKLSYTLLKDKQQIFRASLSDFVDLNLHSVAEAEATGRIVFGGEKAATYGKEGIELGGNFEQFDLVPWLDLLIKEETSNQQNFAATNYDFLKINNLTVNKLSYYFMDFEQVTISADVDDKGFHFNLAGDEIAGNIFIPNKINKTAIDIDLSKLKIADQFPDTQDTITEQTEELTESNAQPFPSLKIQCQECIYNEQAIGATQIIINPLEKGNTFQIKVDELGLLGVDVQGNWQSNNDNEIVTSLSGNMDIAELGKFINLFNIELGIHKTKLKVDGNLSWQGDPVHFNQQTLNGKLSINTGQGNIDAVSDKKARIFSLFSLTSLTRRLTMDFSDLFGDGFFYENMNADFKIAKGVYSTSNFEIEGTSADVDLKGNSDFYNDNMEYCLLVTPNLGASLPILAGWAIQPVTGLVVYLMSKIFQPVIKVVTGILYKVEGPFDNPVITEMGKSEGTVTVDNSEQDGGKSTTTITSDPEQPKFSCDDFFD